MSWFRACRSFLVRLSDLFCLCSSLTLCRKVSNVPLSVNLSGLQGYRFLIANGYLFLVRCGLWENRPYGIRARFTQCAFLVAQVEICQSPDFVIYMSNNPSTNCCRHLRRLVVLYEGEISLHFDLPSRHSRCTWSPLLWALVTILYLDTARFIKLLYVRSPF